MEEIKETNSKLEEKVIEETEEKKEEIQEEVSKEKFKIKTEDVNNNEKKPKKNIFKWIIILGVFLLVAAFLLTGFALININNKNIISGITIDTVNVNGLSKEDAIKLLEKKVDDKLNKKITITVDNEDIEFLLSQIELEYFIEDAVNSAYNIGRDSNIFINNFNILKSKIKGENIHLQYKYNLEQLNVLVNSILSKIPNAVKQVSYCIEDEELIITKGNKGFSIDKDTLKEQIENNIMLGYFSNIYLDVFETEPDEIDIEEIYEDVHKEAQDAYYTTNPFQVYAEVLGVDFNIDEAKEILKEDKEEYIIPLVITKPNKTVNDIGTEAFPDLLSTFSTRYDESNVSRSTNLKIAAGKLNGVVVMPGETLSYNKTVGKRTVEAGYKDAAGYEGGKVVQMLAGGICQVSSTLYDAAVYANLTIVERHNHGFLTSYTGAGKDATVVYGASDLKFKNTRKNPIVIKTSARNGILKVDIYGIKEETEYEIEIFTSILSTLYPTVIYEDDSSLEEGVEKVTQNAMNGCKSITYKILKLNGVEVSREVLSTDTYNAMNKYITRGTKKTTVVDPEPVEPIQPVVQEEPITPTVPEESTTPTQPEPPIIEDPGGPEGPDLGGENEEPNEPGNI